MDFKVKIDSQALYQKKSIYIESSRANLFIWKFNSMKFIYMKFMYMKTWL